MTALGRPKPHPTHRMSLLWFEKGEKVELVSETRPVRREVGTRAPCKYCYRTHRAWWLMPPEEYPPIEDPAFASNEDGRALLCGYCEHVSMACFMDICSLEAGRLP